MGNEQFDAVVIGSGQGGNPLAKATAKHGWKTAVVERRYAGGTCVNDGCTPTKTMVASAKAVEQAQRGAESVMPANRVARANEMAEPRGMWKAVVDRASDEILGAAILGVNGGEVVTQIQLAMMGGLKYTTLRKAVFIHPALAEGLNVLFDSFRK